MEPNNLQAPRANQVTYGYQNNLQDPRANQVTYDNKIIYKTQEQTRSPMEPNNLQAPRGKPGNLCNKIIYKPLG